MQAFNTRARAKERKRGCAQQKPRQVLQICQRSAGKQTRCRYAQKWSR